VVEVEVEVEEMAVRVDAVVVERLVAGALGEVMVLREVMVE
jgi:hypothetical protein